MLCYTALVWFEKRFLNLRHERNMTQENVMHKIRLAYIQQHLQDTCLRHTDTPSRMLYRQYFHVKPSWTAAACRTCRKLPAHVPRGWQCVVQPACRHAAPACNVTPPSEAHSHDEHHHLPAVLYPHCQTCLSQLCVCSSHALRLAAPQHSTLSIPPSP